MKKTASLFLIGAITIAAFGSCKKDKKPDCEAINKQVVDAGMAYANNMNAANCKTYKSALQDLLNSDCAGSLSEEQKTGFQTALNGLTCQE